METKTIVYDLDTSGGLMEVRGRRGRWGCKMARGPPPFTSPPPPGPEPRGHRRKCGRSPNPRWGPSRARTGRARPYPGPTEPCAVGGGGGQSAGGPQSPLCVCACPQQIQALLAPPKSEDGEKRSRRPEKEPRRSGRATNHDSCDSCKEGGDLLCCDHCPAAFHLQCW